MQTHTLWSCKPHMIICCTLPVSEAPSLPPRYFSPPSLHLSFPLISSLHLLSLDFFLPLPNCHFSFFLLTQRLTLSFIWCSSSVMEEISFTTRAVQYWSFLAHKLDVTDLLSCWSIRAKEIAPCPIHLLSLFFFHSFLLPCSHCIFFPL